MLILARITSIGLSRYGTAQDLLYLYRVAPRFPVWLGLKIGASQVGIRATGYLESQVGSRDLLAVDWVSIGVGERASCIISP